MKPKIIASIALSSLTILGCATTPTEPTDGVTRKSEFRVWYTGPELVAELEHRWATRHAGDEWLVLKLAVAGGAKGVTAISRDAITARTPDQETLVLPDQSEFRTIARSLHPALESYDAWLPSSHRFDGSLAPCGEWLFSPPRSIANRETVYPSRQSYCSGPLVFQVPGGVAPGQWQLRIELEETTVSIPFEVRDPAS